MFVCVNILITNCHLLPPSAALVLCGADYVTGSNLPSHSDVQVSCFTGHRIQVGVSLLHCLCLSTSLKTRRNSSRVSFPCRVLSLCWRTVNQRYRSMTLSCGLKSTPSPHWAQESASTPSEKHKQRGHAHRGLGDGRGGEEEIKTWSSKITLSQLIWWQQTNTPATPSV